jgi:hypothetical protein
MPLTNQQNEAFERGMKLRRDNTTLDDVRSDLHTQLYDSGVFDTQVIDGWQFMDHLILGLDMLEGRA